MLDGGPKDAQTQNDAKRRQSLAARVAGASSEESDQGNEIPLPTPESAPRQGMDRIVARRKWPPRRIATVGAGVLFASAVIYQLIFGDHSTRLNVQTERITISTVERGPFQEFIPVRGEVLPIQTIFLDAQENGRVEAVYLEAGAMVQKGDSILKLANPELELKVMDQEALYYEQVNNFENTRITLTTTSISRQQQLLQLEQNVLRRKQEFDQKTELHRIGHLSDRSYQIDKDDFSFFERRLEFMQETVRQDSLSRKTQLAHLEIAQDRLTFNLAAAKRSLSNLTLRAPVSGQLTSLNAEIGEQKSKGLRLGQVDVLDGFRVRAQIDEFYITRINAGQTGTFELAAKPFELTIRRVYPEVLEGRFVVDMMFPKVTPEDIRRGQTLQIRLALGDLEEALLLERGGFYQTTGGNWVFVIENEGEAVRRDVRIGRQNPEYFEVLDGLRPGERVITSSYENYEEIEKLVLK